MLRRRDFHRVPDGTAPSPKETGRLCQTSQPHGERELFTPFCPDTQIYQTQLPIPLRVQRFISLLDTYLLYIRPTEIEAQLADSLAAGPAAAGILSPRYGGNRTLTTTTCPYGVIANDRHRFGLLSLFPQVAIRLQRCRCTSVRCIRHCDGSAR